MRSMQMQMQCGWAVGWVLWASILALGARGDVLFFADNFTATISFPAMPADFGPDLEDYGPQGAEGVLLLADPLDACQPFTFSELHTPWVALIDRAQPAHPTNCTFDVKVRHAQRAGAVAAIVYDDAFEALVIMAKPPGAEAPLIPAVFVSEKAGAIMRQLMDGTTRVRILPVSPMEWLSLAMSTLLGVLALTVVMATFYVMRSWSLWLGHTRHRRLPGDLGYMLLHGDEGLSPGAIKLLPVITVERRPRPDPQPSAAAAAASAAAAGSPPCGPPPPPPAGDAPSASPRSAAAAAGDADGGWPSGASAASDDADSSCDAEEAARPPGSRGGETRRVCAICLERYAHGDRVRVLPCSHRFHVACVDQWLRARRLCPVCKHDASMPPPGALGLAAGAAGGGGADGGGGGDADADGEGGSSSRRWPPLLLGRQYWIRRLGRRAQRRAAAVAALRGEGGAAASAGGAGSASEAAGGAHPGASPDPHAGAGDVETGAAQLRRAPPRPAAGTFAASAPIPIVLLTPPQSEAGSAGATGPTSALPLLPGGVAPRAAAWRQVPRAGSASAGAAVGAPPA